MHQFSQINNRVMALDLYRNFVSAQYLETKLMEFNQILHMPRCRLGLLNVNFH